MPTIRDGELGVEVANLRREVTATQVERTRLTFAYNAALKFEAESRELPFIDLTPRLLDTDRGIIADIWRHRDPKDHHLAPGAGRRLWAEHLNALAALLLRARRHRKALSGSPRRSDTDLP